MLLTIDSGPKFQTKTTKTPQDLRRGEKFTTAGPRPAALSTKNDKKKKTDTKLVANYQVEIEMLRVLKKKKKRKRTSTTRRDALKIKAVLCAFQKKKQKKTEP